jgi:CheY-like chemotaxis protein
MPSFLAEKSSKVLVVESSGSIRQMMADVMRSGLGYENVEGLASVNDTIKFLEVDRAHWIILSLFADQTTNAMHLLRLCTEHSELKNVRVSLFVDEEETYVLPTAFAYGLLSCHKKPFTKDTFDEELKKLLALLERDSFHEPLTCGRYLRDVLKSQTKHHDQLELEKNLLSIYPGNPQVLFNMAEPQFHLGNKDATKSLFHQVRLLDESMRTEIDQLATTLLGAPLEGSSANESQENVLGLNTCVVIDPDEAVNRDITEILGSLGVKDIKTYLNGEDAWNGMKEQPAPDLIIMEWRIPKISGPALLQRIRQHGFLTTPVILLSSLIKSEDLPLIKEIGIANLISKPLSRSAFLPNLIATIRQERMPTEHQTLERKIREFIQAGKNEDALPLLTQFLGDPSVPIGRKRLIEAEQAYAKGNYFLARDAAIQSLKTSGDSLLVLNILGKAFMHLKDHMSALKCFQRAQEMSPNNIERLCNIAESQSEIGDNDAAKETLGNAKNLDGGSEKVSEAEAKVALAQGDVESAKEIMSDMKQVTSLVAYMNNKAVAYAKCGFPKEAVEIYEKTIQSIPEKEIQTKAVVTYNFALSLIKMNDFENASAKLLTLSSIESKVTKKAASLADRLKKTIESGQEFKLRTDEKPAVSPTPSNPESASKHDEKSPGPSDDSVLASEQDYRDMLAAIDLKKGDLCCFLIFQSPDVPDTKSSALLAKTPRFQIRHTIEKMGGGGPDQNLKQSA